MTYPGRLTMARVLKKAWQNRLHFRHEVHRKIVRRIAALGELANGWTNDAAADLFYALTLPGPWRELTLEVKWSDRQYVDAMTPCSAGLCTPLKRSRRPVGRAQDDH